MMQKLMVRPVTAAEVRTLRQAVLRPGQAAEALIYPGDDAQDALHAGAFHNDALVGIASVARDAYPYEERPESWRLRGMATLPEVRGMGYGRALIKLCLAHIGAHGGRLLWCNGRTPARAFYERLGFVADGDEFITETGPHYVFWREV